MGGRQQRGGQTPRGPVGIALVILAVLLLVSFFVYLTRSEHRLEEEAVQALPGPLTDTPRQATQRGAPPATRPSDKQRDHTRQEGRGNA